MYTKLDSSGCLDNSAEDEPIFILVARDRTAPAAVRAWATRAANVGANPAKVTDAFAVAAAMEKWQKDNPEKVKTPD